MFNYFYDEIKKMEGNVLALGIDDKLINALKRNKKINAYEISKSERIRIYQQKKRKMESNYKNMNIKKLHK